MLTIGTGYGVIILPIIKVMPSTKLGIAVSVALLGGSLLAPDFVPFIDEGIAIKLIADKYKEYKAGMTIIEGGIVNEEE